MAAAYGGRAPVGVWGGYPYIPLTYGYGGYLYIPTICTYGGTYIYMGRVGG